MNADNPNLFAGRYELLKVLGEGGFSVVHHAIDVTSKREVAIKILKQEHGSYPESVVARFEREVQVIAQLRDPFTVTMYDSGRTDDGLLFMVSEYIPGRDLSQVLRDEKRLPGPVVVHILRQLLSSLGEAHRLGLLHRDIKPENIRIFRYGNDSYRAKLLDFGIARPVEQAKRDSITRDGELIGTPRYMSPEQLREQTLTPASDLYSLGLVAYELLLGETALQGSSWSAQFDRLMTEEVVAITQDDDVGPHLQRVLRRMTAREPEQRFPSAEAVAAALQNPLILAGGHSRALLAPADISAEEGNRSLWIFVGVIAVVFIGIVSALLAFSRPETAPLTRAQASERLAASALLKGAESAKVQHPAPTIEDLGALNDAPPQCRGKVPFRGRGALQIGTSLDSWPAHIPETYSGTEPVPLVLVFHPDGQNGNRMLAQTKFGELAEGIEGGFITVAPNYQGNAIPMWLESEDVATALDVVADTSAELCIDPTRIYAVGHGSGGNVVERLACLDSFAAVATNGFRSPTTQHRCPDPKPKPMLMLSPMNSERMRPDGTKGCPNANALIPLVEHEQKWIARNKCSKTPKTTEMLDGKCMTYDSCDAAFISCHVDGGYGWPGEPQMPEKDILGNCADVIRMFPATQTIWGFFESTSG